MLASCGGHSGSSSVLPPGTRQRLTIAQAAVVQSQSIAGSFSATFAAPPAATDLLVAIGFNGKSSIACAGGWTQIRHVTAKYDDGLSCYRVVNGDTATVTPFTGTASADAGGIVWEISGESATGFIDAETGAEGGAHTIDLTFAPAQSGDIIVGAAATNTVLSGIVPSGFTQDYAAAPVALTGFSALGAHKAGAVSGSQTVTWAFNSTTDTHPVTAMMIAIAGGGALPPPTATPTASPSPVPTASPTPLPTPASGGGSALTIMQSGSMAGALGTTLAKPPADGDLLIAIGFNSRTSIACASGWTTIRAISARYVDGQGCYRIASAQSASVVPFASSNPGNVGGYLWDVAGQASIGFIDAQTGAEGGAHSITLTFAPPNAGDLVVGGEAINASLNGINPAGFAQDLAARPLGGTGFSALFSHKPDAAAGSQSVTWAFNSTSDTHPVTAMMVAIHGNPGATPSPAPSPTPTASGHTDWLSMGYDVQRTGYNPDERTIGTGSFGTLHALWSQSVTVSGGEIGEPAYASGVTISGQPVNVLYAGSGNGMFFAFNADTGATIWTKQLGAASYSCGTFNGTFGVDGAPAIDRGANRIYVGDGTDNVHALDLATGAEASGWPVSIGGTSGHDFIYAGLTFNPANGMLYAETSSTCDISPWHGRIAAINAGSATVVNTFFPAQGASGGSIWGFGGASIDPATNDVFIATGNGDTTNGGSATAGYSEQIVQLSPDLSTVLAHNYATLPPSGDADFGATPLLFQPPGCPPLLAAVNKSGLFVLYARGNIAAGPAQSIAMSIATDNGDFIGVPAYDPVTNYVYVGLPATMGIYKPGLAAFSIAPDCTLNPTPVWNAAFGADGATLNDDTPRSPISIANGVAYVSDYQTSTTYAFDAATGAQLWSKTLGGKGIVGPIVVNGKLYIGNIGGAMTAWTP